MMPATVRLTLDRAIAGAALQLVADRDLRWYFGSKLAPGALGLVSVGALVRLGGIEVYGVFTLIWTVGLVAANVGTGWLRQSVLRFVGDGQRTFISVGALPVLGSIVAAGLSVIPVTIWLLPARANVSLVLAAVCLTCSLAGQSVAVSVLQSLGNPRRVATSEAVRASLSLAIPCIGLVLWPSSAVLVGSVAFATALSILPCLPGVSLPSRATVIPGAAVSWWRFGWPMSVWLAVSTVLQFSDRLVLQSFSDLRTVGSYSAVYDIVTRGVGMLLFPITMTFHPRIMRSWNSGLRRTAQALNRKSMRLQIVVFLPVLALTWESRHLLADYASGGAIPGAASWVTPILLGAFCWQLALSAHKALEMLQRTRTMLVLVIACATFNVVANICLVPVYGANAAAWTTLGSALLYLVLCRMATYRERPTSDIPLVGNLEETRT